MDFKDLTPEQQEMARACKSVDELVELAKSFGVQLSEEELAAVAGGVGGCIRGFSCLLYSPSPEPNPECPVKDSCPKVFTCPSLCSQLGS